MTYEPKKGDRVKVTYEGVVDWVSSNTTDFTIEGNQFIELNTFGATIEKLQDPEPQWVNGDVIEVKWGLGTTYERPRTVVLVNGQWMLADGGEPLGVHFIGNHWPENVKILYKADKQDAGEKEVA